MRLSFFILISLYGCAPSVDNLDSRAIPGDEESQQPAQLTAADFRGSSDIPSEYLDESRFARADTERGEILSLACQACHSLEEEGPVLIGPNLHGIFGRVSGSVVAFEYSQALQAATIVWTPKALDAWLMNPEQFLPDNNMVFAGFHSAEDRRDLISFLLHKTSASE